MTGVMPVAGSAAKSSAMMFAEPRRNAYGEAIIRPIRTGISHGLPALVLVDDLLDRVGAGRPAASRTPCPTRWARSRSDRPSSYRSARGRAGRRSEAKPVVRAGVEHDVPVGWFHQPAGQPIKPPLR